MFAGDETGDAQRSYAEETYQQKGKRSRAKRV